MSKLPKLRVLNPSWGVAEEIRDFKQGKYLPFNTEGMWIVVEDQVINSYEDLVQLAAENRYKDKEFLEVSFLYIVVGG
ncbi:hypothetical protein ACFLVO_01650 [Chloroflexota bacterium]